MSVPTLCAARAWWSCFASAQPSMAAAIKGATIDTLPARDACRVLIAKAALLWRTNEGQYRDDITAIVGYLRPVVQGLEAEVSTGRERTTSVAGSARGQVAAMAPLAEEAEVA